jgi:hypothetical protein
MLIVGFTWFTKILVYICRICVNKMTKISSKYAIFCYELYDKHLHTTEITALCNSYLILRMNKPASVQSISPQRGL